MAKYKNHFKELYSAAETYVVRNPLFPIKNFFDWSHNQSEITLVNKEYLETSLAEFYSQPLAQEALYIASPDLHLQMEQWLAGKIDKPEKKDKIVISLIKYMIRMCTRCTPYGLFASCSVGDFSNFTDFKLADKNDIDRHARLDMDYVGEVLAHLLKQKEITSQLKFYPNTSLYPMGQQLRYVEHRFQENTGRSYHLMQADNSEYLQKTLTAATVGLLPKELADLLVGDEISSEEAVEFIYEVIESQLLVSEIEPNVTGEEYFFTLLKKLKSCKGTERFIPPFEHVVKDLIKIKKDSSSDKKLIYQGIAETLKELEVPLHLKTLLQVDSYRPALSHTINKAVMDRISEGASLLHLLTSGNQIHDNFYEFKDRFTKRYESQFVPLVEVLDTESGIGYGKFLTSGMEESPLIQNLPMGEEQENKQPQFEDADVFMWKLYQQAILENKTEVVIDEKTIEQLSKKELKTNGLQDSVFTIAKIYASSVKEIDSGNYKITMQSPSGPSGANLLGRFSHLHPDIENLTKKILSEEAIHQPDCIFAEIVHLPESRIGNILMRPVLRAFEIPYLCRSAVDPENQIPVTDLLVGIEGNKVVLISKKLDKKVIPRMTTAHNFSLTTLPVYQFLCDLQNQQIRHSGWDWKILNNRPFLPRVCYQNIILSKARWTITKADISSFEKNSDVELISKFDEFASLKNLPRYVLLSQGDNELMLDLKNIWCLKILFHEIVKSNLISLTETLDTPDNCWIASNDGKHTGEFIFAFNRKENIQ
ncbi:MAG: lantibiotic dehydratase family protein, partial [Chitinophagales bacterium]